MGRRGARKAGPSARATHEFFGQGLPDVSAPQATTTTHDPQHPPAETPTENPCSSDPLDHPLPQIPSPDITLFAPTALSIDAKAEFIFTHVSCVFVLSCSECLLTDQFHSQLYNEGLVRLYYQYKIDKLPVLDGLLTKFSSNYRRRVPDRDTYVWHVDLEIIKQFAEAHVHEESTFFSINGAESTGVKPEDIVITVVDRVGELEVVLCIVEFFLETARKHQVQYGAPHEISLISLGLILFTYRHKRLAPNNVKHQKVWDWFYEGRKSRMDTKENLIFTSPQKIPKLKEGEVDEMSFAQLSVGDKIYEWIEETKAAQAEAKAAENINGEGAGAVNGSTADKTTQTEDGALADITNGAATAPGPANGGSGKGRRNKKKKEKKKAKGKRDTANPDVQNPSSEDVSASGVSHTVDDAAAVAPGPVNGASGKGKGKGKARDTDNAPAYNPGPDDVSAPGVAHTVNDDDDTPTLTASAGVTALPAPGVGTDPGPGPRPAHRATRKSIPHLSFISVTLTTPSLQAPPLLILTPASIAADQ